MFGISESGTQELLVDLHGADGEAERAAHKGHDAIEGGKEDRNDEERSQSKYT